jgi:lipopolysaccharide/colanic/teichoic acid biosynthesis glycosyltransferase
LDELPQLFNVLDGSMSLVGPRPHTVEDVAEYRKGTHERLGVPPGITGPWQVGGRCDLSGDESLRLDVEYVRHGSLMIDIALMLRTIRAVVSGQGAM